ncbi:MAG: type II secretion system protein [Verrucomicrobiae bacterium]|nr:type II secretion system protein [Verrucomicrobiae bacterium]
MKTTQPNRTPSRSSQPSPRGLRVRRRADRERGFTLIELLTVITIITILASVSYTGVKGALYMAKMNAAMQNAKQIGNGLRAWAADYDGIFPGEMHPVTEEEFSSANDVFAALLPSYIDTERVFPVAGCAWGSRADGRFEEESDRLKAGENHWAYVAGLTTTSMSDWPLIVDGTNGSGQYVSQPNEKGGVWEGKKAIVIRVGGSAETVPLLGENDERYIPRIGYPEENALDVSSYMGKGVTLMEPED